MTDKEGNLKSQEERRHVVNNKCEIECVSCPISQLKGAVSRIAPSSGSRVRLKVSRVFSVYKIKDGMIRKGS
jgi:hypothetical protein